MSEVVNIAAAMMGDTMATTTETRPIAVITAEIQVLKTQVGIGIVEIGRRLVEAKAQLSHGDWLPWLDEQVQFSEAQAQRFMRLAKEYSNPSPVTDLGMRKALALLAFKPEEREEFVAETHIVDGEEKTVIDMSARELEQAIRERKEAVEAKETAEAERRTAEASRVKMEQEAIMSSRRIDTLTVERDKQDAALVQLRAELEELRAQPVDIIATNVPDEAMLEHARQSAADEAAKAARKETEEKLKEKLDKAAKAKSDAEAALKAAQQERDAIRERAEALERQVKASSGKELATASVCFEAAQESVNKVFGVVQKLALSGNAEEHNKLVDALHALFAALDARVPEKLEVSAS